MSKNSENRILELINRKDLSKDESVELIDEIYWADWSQLESRDKDIVEKIFAYVARGDLSNEETSKLLKLYNNLDGAHTIRFADLILHIYKTNKKKFLKSLNLEKEEAINIVYIFRMNDIDLSKDQELLDLIRSDELTEEEREIGESFFKMYENICNT